MSGLGMRSVHANVRRKERREPYPRLPPTDPRTDINPKPLDRFVESVISPTTLFIIPVASHEVIECKIDFRELTNIPVQKTPKSSAMCYGLKPPDLEELIQWRTLQLGPKMSGKGQNTTSMLSSHTYPLTARASSPVHQTLCSNEAPSLPM